MRALKAALGEVVTTGLALKPNRGQQLALGLALVRDFVLISGGPGTGKTSIVFSLLRCLIRSGTAVERIALAAPTGRAAQRLTDVLRTGLDGLGANRGSDDALKDLAAQTLHHLLGYNPSRDTYLHHGENPLPYDVVIVDEVSMVGLVLMAHLFQALAPATKLILLGDKDQLPSVDAGAVLTTLASAERTPRYSAAVCAQLTALWDNMVLEASTASDPLKDALVILEENYRSQKGIRDISRALNAQQMEVVDAIPSVTLSAGEACGPFAELERRTGCWLLEQGHGELAKWRWTLEQWATHHYLSPRSNGDVYQDLVVQCENIDAENMQPQQKTALDRLFAALAGARILTLVREGPWGCNGVNAGLEQVLRPRLDREGFRNLFAGMPVLVTRNDYTRLLFNGDVGIALRGRGGYRVVFQRAGNYSIFPAEALPAHEPAFAMTVHKSQGSEYEQVMLVLPPEGGRRLLTKEMVYTGITRAKQLAVICAKRDVLRHAVSRKVEHESALLEFSTD
jgi:exodeoxyribonuclease V alpha subunit